MAMNFWKLSPLFGLTILCLAPPFASAQTVTFLPKVDYPTQGLNSGMLPYTVATGDLNNDTYPDIVSVNFNSNNISIFINNGNGTFANAVTHRVGNTPRSLVIADLNGDNHLDVAVANSGTGIVSVCFGNSNGSGTLNVSIPYSVGGFPTAIAAGDVNNDGLPDLVVAGSVLSVLLNSGAGVFSALPNIATDSATGLVLADFDGDNKLDVALTTTQFNRISIMKGIGNGAFDAPSFLTLPIGGALAIRYADVDGDQIGDLLTANSGNGAVGRVSYRKGIGNGTFSNGSDTQLGSVPVALGLGDMNGDGFLDIVFANRSQGEAAVGAGNGTGAFTDFQDFATGAAPNGVAIADVDKDGKQDIITANSNSDSISVLINSTPAAGYIVSGRILLQGTSSAAVPLNFTFTPQDGSMIFTRTVIPAANGDYALAAIPPKLYFVGIKGSKWLRSRVTANTTTGNVTGLNTTLRGGDASNDNAADIIDLLLLIARYNQQQGTGNYLEAADFNNDGFCDIVDLLILITNYNVVGSP